MPIGARGVPAKLTPDDRVRGLGDAAETCRWLAAAGEARPPWLWSLSLEPVFDGLRAQPCFAAIVTRLGLAKIH